MNPAKYIWLIVAFILGLFTGSMCFGQMEDLMLYLIKLNYYRPLLVFSAITVNYGLYLLVLYLEKVEAVRAEAGLTLEAKSKIRHEIQDELAAKAHTLVKKEEALQAQRQRLQRVSSRIIEDNEKLHKDQLAFITYMNQISGILSRRSQKFLDTLPDIPIAANYVQQRDASLQVALADILQEMQGSFPDLAVSNSMPTIPLPTEENHTAPNDRLEGLQPMKEKPTSTRVPEYKKKLLRRPNSGK